MGPQDLTWQWRVIETVVVGLVRTLRWRLDTEGIEHVPERGGAVLTFNHHSYFDFVMIGWDVVRELRRPLRFLAKRELWESPATRWIMRWGGAVPVDRRDASSRHGALAAAIRALERGELVVVAPEQTISRSFELLPFSTGAVRMAQQAGVPIVPCVGWGTQRFATKGRGVHLATRIPVVVRYGEPMHVGKGEDPRIATKRLRETTAGMLDEVQRRYPDTPGPGDDWWLPARLGGSAPPHDEVLDSYQRRRRRWARRERPEDQQRPEDRERGA